MPTYEYRCRDCGHTFDIVQKMSDDPLTHCPECGGELRKVFAPPAISFKGSGFYATDHGKKSKPAGESKNDAEKKPASTEGGTTKKETSSDSSASSTTTKKEGSS
ncbi:MAG TPA: FmdB family zinc ribbon protein [Actinomycetota bacterium]|jgi:putative FmdB family regulatory protein|nr:FmdB family zinc ribbon protein [Actinomycetota bacterium]